MKKYWEDPIVIENKYLSNSLRRDESTRVVLSTNSNSSDGQLEAQQELDNMNTIDQLKEYDRLYFNEGTSPLTDTEYDLLKTKAKNEFPNDPYF